MSTQNDTPKKMYSPTEPLPVVHVGYDMYGRITSVQLQDGINHRPDMLEAISKWVALWNLNFPTTPDGSMSSADRWLMVKHLGGAK
jgi:hypothetical protein